MSHIWQGCDSGEVALCVAYNHQACRQFIVKKHQSKEFTEDFNIKVDGVDVFFVVVGVVFIFPFKQVYQTVQSSEQTALK